MIYNFRFNVAYEEAGLIEAIASTLYGNGYSGYAQGEGVISIDDTDTMSTFHHTFKFLRIPYSLEDYNEGLDEAHFTYRDADGVELLPLKRNPYASKDSKQSKALKQQMADIEAYLDSEITVTPQDILNGAFTTDDLFSYHGSELAKAIIDFLAKQIHLSGDMAITTRDDRPLLSNIIIDKFAESRFGFPDYQSLLDALTAVIDVRDEPEKNYATTNGDDAKNHTISRSETMSVLEMLGKDASNTADSFVMSATSALSDNVTTSLEAGFAGFGMGVSALYGAKLLGDAFGSSVQEVDSYKANKASAAPGGDKAAFEYAERQSQALDYHLKLEAAATRHDDNIKLAVENYRKTQELAKNHVAAPSQA